MRRIDSPSGFFVDGNAGNGTPGTILTAAWLNAVQEEIISVLSAAGVAIDAAKTDQLSTAINTLLRGKATVSVTGGASVALTAAQYNMPILILTGALTANINVIFPASSGAWIVRNQTTGNFTVTCKTQAGTGVVVSQGFNNALWGDGTNIYAEQTDWASILAQAATAFTSAGAAPSFTLTPSPVLTAYVASTRFRVKFHANGTGADTLNVSGLGAKSIKQYDSSGSKVAAVVVAGQLADVEYDGVDFVILDPLPGGLPNGYLSGLTLSNNATASNTDIDVASGRAKDSAGLVDIVLAVGLTKRLQSAGAWSAGNNGNGLFSGAKANSTWYHVFAIRKDSDGSIDIGFDTSITAANRPAGYSNYVLIESVKTDASGNLIPFLHTSRKMWWKTPIKDVNVTGLTGAASANYTLSVPPGRRVVAKMFAYFSADNAAAYIRCPDFPDIAVNDYDTYTLGLMTVTSSALDIGASEANVLTNTSSQVAARTTTGRTHQLQLVTIGWEAV